MKKKSLILPLLIASAACKKNNTYTPPPVVGINYQEIALVADLDQYGAAMTDTKLLNAWGIALNPMGIVWISSNHAGATTIYDSTGKTLFGPVAIPSQGDHFGGTAGDRLPGPRRDDRHSGLRRQRRTDDPAMDRGRRGMAGRRVACHDTGCA